MFRSLFIVSVCVYGVLSFHTSTVFATAMANSKRNSKLHMGVSLAPLPYEYNALEPHIGEQTLRVHHDKHHARYVATATSMIAGTEFENSDVVTILQKSHGKNPGLFNNAAQSFNHEFYWNCMKPNGGGKPTGKIASLIDLNFGSYEKFREEFVQAALTQFGSGWAWLVWTPEGLKITKTSNADCPLTEKNHIPLLTIDVWEHAYYLNYQNLRTTYVDVFLDNLVNWEFVESNLPENNTEL